MNSISAQVFQILVFLFSVVIHEVAHGVVAFKLGDQTAKNAGRLTLNPIPHLDPIGSVLLPFLLVITNSSFIIGWAKPVPYNPFNLHKDLKNGPLKVALAGPVANFALALIIGLGLRASWGFIEPVLAALLVQIVIINVLLGVFNLIPIPPLDGSKLLTLFLPPKYSLMIQSFGLAWIGFVFLFVYMFSDLIFSLTTFLTNLIIGPPIPIF